MILLCSVAYFFNGYIQENMIIYLLIIYKKFLKIFPLLFIQYDFGVFLFCSFLKIF